MRNLYKNFVCLFFFAFVASAILAAPVMPPPSNDDCGGAITLGNVNNFCSASAAYTNVGATTSGFAAPACWSNCNNDVWFQFTATATDVNITIYGNTSGYGTMNRPEVALYSGSCAGTITTQGCASAPAGQNFVTLYKGALVIGATYYIRVDGNGTNTGTFKICINNYTPPNNPGADCTGASKLCNKNTVNNVNVTGAGANNRESAGTCLDNSVFGGAIESNSVWYSWVCATSGTLTLDITPIAPSDDLDWVLFELTGAGGTCGSKTNLRCVAASCIGATGMRASSADISEPAGCAAPNDNYVSQYNMVAGKTYAILINNFTSANNGFSLSFGGTGTFVGPTANFNINPASTRACADAATFTFTDASTLATTYSWDFGAGATPATSTAAGPHTVTYSTSGVKTIVLEITGGNGCKVVTSKTITVDPLPVAPTASNTTICAGNTSTLTATAPGGTYKWYDAAAAGTLLVTNASYTTPVLASSTTVYVATTDINGCTSPRTPVTVTVNPLPAAPTAAGATICSGNTATLTATAPAGATFNWYNAATAGTLLTTGSSYTTPVLGTTTTYWVDATVSGCTGARTAVVVTVNPIPAAPTAAGVTICANNTATLNATAPAGVTFNWYNAAAAGTLLGTGASYTTPSLTTTTTYWVDATASGCTGARTAVVVTVNPTPAAPTAPGTIICSGNTATLTATAPAGATFNWYNAAVGGTLLTTGNSYTTPVLSTTTTYWVDAKIGGCVGARTAVVVTVNAIPASPTVAGATICAGNTATLTATAPAGATFNWYNAAVAGTLLNTGASYTTPALATTTTYWVDATAAGCIGARTAVVVTVNPIPAAPTAAGVTICANNTATLNATAPAGVTFNWYNASTAGTLLGTGSSYTSPVLTTTTTYWVDATATGCTSVRTAVVVTVNPQPVAPTAPGVTICSGNTATITATAPGGTYNWYNAAVAGTLLGTGASYTTPVLATTTTYWVDATTGGCTGPRTAVVVTVNPIPNVVIGPQPPICSGATTNISLSSGVAGTTFNWNAPVVTGTVTGGTLGSSPSTIAQTLNNTGTAPGTVTYSVTPTANTCNGTPVTVTVTVNPIPVATATDVTICSGQTTNILLNSNVAGTTFNWTATNAGVSTATAGSDPTKIAQTLNASGFIQGIATYTVTPVANGCSGTPITVKAFVNPTPDATATPSTATVCSGTAPSPAIGLSSNVAGTTFNWPAPAVTGGITGGVAGPGTSIANVLTNPSNTVAGTVTYTITPIAATCPGTPITVVITVNPTPIAPSPNPATYCKGATASPLTAVGSGLKWYGTDCSTLLPSAPTPVTTAAGTFTYCVSQVVNGCESAKAPLVVTINDLPPAPVSPSPLTYCQGATIPDLSATPSMGGIIKWYGDNLLTQFKSLNPYASGATSSISYWVIEEALGCKGPATKVDIVINPSDDPTFSYPSNLYCVTGSDPTPTVTLPGGTFSVTPAGLVIAANGTIDLSASTPNTYSITYTTNGICPMTSPPFLLTITTSPDATFSYAGPYCQGTNNIISPTMGPGAVAGVFTSVPPLSGLDANTGEIDLLAATDGTFTITNSIAAGGGCAATSDTKTVVINPTPTVAADKLTESICSGQTTNINLSGTPAGVSFTYTVVNITGPITPATGGSGTSIAKTLTNNGATPATITYEITPSVAGNTCPAVPLQVVETVNPIPAAPTATNPNPYCQNDVASALSATGTGTLNWFDGAHSPIVTLPIIPSTTTSGPTTYYVSQTVNGCTSPETPVVVTVNPLPPAPVVAGASYCPGAPMADLTAAGPGTFKWYIAGSQVGVGNTYTPTNTVTTTIDVTETRSGCTGPSTSVVVTIRPKDDATFSYSGATFCITGSDPVPTSIVTPGGVFSAPAPVVIDPATGVINVASTGLVNNVPITYTTSGICPDTKTVNITITTAPQANFSYTGPYCTTGSASPTIVAPNSPGAFSSTPGIVLNPNTGDIDLTNSTPGTYTVQNDIAASGGCAPANGTATVTINPAPPAPTVTPKTYCQNDVAVPLTATFTGTQNWYPGPTSTPTTPSTSTVGTISYPVSQTVAGCEGPKANILITVNPLPPAPVSTPVAPYCQGAVIAPLTATGTGGTIKWYSDAGLTTQIGANSPFNSGITSTTTIYVNETNSGCKGPGTAVTITVNPLDDASFSYTSGTYCKTGGTNPIPTIVRSGGTFGVVPATASVNASTGVIDLATIPTGTYTISYTTNGPCPQTKSTVVNIVTAATATFSYAGPYCMTVANPLPTFNPGASAGTFTSTAGLNFVNSNTGEIDLTTSTPGTYTVTNTITGGGCPTVTATNSVTLNPTPVAPVVTDLTYCKGFTPVPPLTPSGAGDTWYNGAFPFGTAIPTPTPSTAAAGVSNYYVSHTQNGCEGPRAVLKVTVNDIPAVPTGPTPILYCKNDVSVALAATVSGIATWYPPVGLPSPIAPTPSTAVAGTVNYYVTDKVNNCESPKFKITVTVNSTPPPTASNVVYCKGATASAFTATALAGATLNWYDSMNVSLGSTAPIPLTTNSGVATYYVSQTLNNCESTKTTIKVTVSAPPLLVMTAQSPCLGSASYPLTASVTTGGNTLNWYNSSMTLLPGAPTIDPSVPANTTYYVSQVTSAGASPASCEGPLASIPVNVIVTPAPTPSDTTYCQNGIGKPVHATGTNLLWYLTQTSAGTAVAPTLSTSNAGKDSVFVTQQISGCTSPMAVLYVTVNALPTAPIATSTTICTGNVSTLTATAPGGTYFWYDNSLAPAGSGNSITSPSLVSSTNYFVETMDANNCVSPRTTVPVTVNAIPLAPVIDNRTICSGDTVILRVQSPIVGATYDWFTVAAGGSSVFSNSIVNLPAQSSSVTYYVETSFTGCTGPRAQVDLTVIQRPGAPVVPPQDSICENASFISITANSGIGNFEWYADAAMTNSLSGSNPFLPSGSITTTTSFFVREIVGNCPGPLTTVVVPMNPTVFPTVSITPNAPEACEGKPVNFVASPNKQGSLPTYEWFVNSILKPSPGGTTFTPPLPLYNSDTILCVLTVGPDVTCRDKPKAYSNKEIVTINKGPIFAPKYTATGCDPLITDLQAVDLGPGSKYSWVFAAGDSSAGSTVTKRQFNYNNGASETIILRETTGKGCYNDTSFTVTVFEQPKAYFSYSPDVISNLNPRVDFIDKTVGKVDVWSWTFGDNDSSSRQNVTHTYKKEGGYPVTLFVVNTTTGCNSTFTQPLAVLEDYAFYIPDAFTPNGDGKNDTFGGRGIGVAEYDMRIYSRWGGELFHSTDINRQWDGTAYNTPEIGIQDIYIYKITVVDVHKKKHDYVGKVTLIK